jgi:hypothetical protein
MVHFAGANWWAIGLCAFIGMAVGALWYRIFGARWMAAAQMTGGMRHGVVPYVVGFVGNFVIAIGIAGLLGHFGPGNQISIRHGIITGAGAWLGFTITTMATNYAFAGRRAALLAIDGGYWLVNMTIMGVIIGAMGVR